MFCIVVVLCCCCVVDMFVFLFCSVFVSVFGDVGVVVIVFVRCATARVSACVLSNLFILVCVLSLCCCFVDIVFGFFSLCVVIVLMYVCVCDVGNEIFVGDFVCVFEFENFLILVCLSVDM